MAEVEVRTCISAAPSVVIDLELDAAAHSASLASSGETAKTSTGRSALALGPLGSLGSAASLVLAPYLHRLLVERARFIKASAASARKVCMRLFAASKVSVS